MKVFRELIQKYIFGKKTASEIQCKTTRHDEILEYYNVHKKYPPTNCSSTLIRMILRKAHPLSSDYCGANSKDIIELFNSLKMYKMTKILGSRFYCNPVITKIKRESRDDPKGLVSFSYIPPLSSEKIKKSLPYHRSPLSPKSKGLSEINSESDNILITFSNSLSY